MGIQFIAAIKNMRCYFEAAPPGHDFVYLEELILPAENSMFTQFADMPAARAGIATVFNEFKIWIALARDPLQFISSCGALPNFTLDSITDFDDAEFWINVKTTLNPYNEFTFSFGIPTSYIKRVQNYSVKVTNSPQSLCSLKETAFTKISGFRKYTL